MSISRTIFGAGRKFFPQRLRGNTIKDTVFCFFPKVDAKLARIQSIFIDGKKMLARFFRQLFRNYI